MAIVKTVADSDNLSTHLGSPSLAAGDEIEVTKYATDFIAGTNLSGTDLLKVTIGPGSSSRFLSANGGALKLTANRTSTGKFINQTSADALELESTSTAGVIYNIINNPKNSGSILRVNTCDTQNVYQITGTFVQQTDADFNSVYVLGGRFFSRNGSAAVVNFEVHGGFAEMARDVTTATLRGGQTNITNSAFTPTTINIGGSAVVKVIETGNWGTLNGLAGVIDLTECRSSGGSSGYLFTISAGTILPGLTIRQVKGGLLPDYSACSLPAGAPKIEFV